jgi:hypothetical protein
VANRNLARVSGQNIQPQGGHDKNQDEAKKKITTATMVILVMGRR